MAPFEFVENDDPESVETRDNLDDLIDEVARIENQAQLEEDAESYPDFSE